MPAPALTDKTPAEHAIPSDPQGVRDLARLEPWLMSQQRANRRRAAGARPFALAGARGPVSVALLTAALAGPAAAVASGHVVTAASERRTAALARGATGPAVRALQVALRVPADGIFGPQTERALRRLQRARDLRATGVADSATKRALRLGSQRTLRSRGARAAVTPQVTSPASAAAETPASTGVAGPAVQRAVAAAMTKVGSPYRSGATGPGAFDCSGLVVWAMRQAGIDLPRTSFAQYEVGSPVAPRRIRTGDLVFFDTAGPGASDVGIATGPDIAVSATTHGVMTHSIRGGYWGSHFVGARRIG